MLEQAYRNAADLLVTSGGMSVGREDRIRSTIGRRGTLDIWALAIKAGRPVGFGDIDACPILALPGNPIAAMFTFIAFGHSVVDTPQAPWRKRQRPSCCQRDSTVRSS